MSSITNTANITKGLTNRIEVCVINIMFNYGFNVNRESNIKKVIEKPELPSLVIGESGVIQEGLTEQSKTNLKNHYELIEQGR